MKKFLSVIVAFAMCSVMAFGAVATVSAKGSQDYEPKDGDTIAVFHTNYGDIGMYFFPEEAPKGVENFQTLARDGKYDNTIFHRVIENFMIQGGDYTNFDGTGGESCWGEDFELECVDYLSNIRGAVAYANAGPDTNSSQFYINSSDNSQSLDGSYTVFGQVFTGMDVVDLISDCEKTYSSNGEQSHPVNEVKLESVEVTEYSDGMENNLAKATDPYEGQAANQVENDTIGDDSSTTTDKENDEPFNFIPIIVTVGILAIIFACFAIPYGISERKKKKAKEAKKAAMKANPDYKKKKSSKKRK